jgi:adenosine deaminase
MSLDDVALIELHQHLDGSIPPRLQWQMMCANELNPVETFAEMERLLVIQPEEEGSLLGYLDKFHFPLWITQFYENIREVTVAVLGEAWTAGARLLELRYAPIIHTYAGLTLRQSIRAVLSGMNAFRADHPDFECGLVIIAMRQHGPHIAKILARQAVSEAQHLHSRSGVVGFDIAGMERGNPCRLFRDAYEIARRGGLGLTAHAGEDEGPDNVWDAVEELGVQRVGHACTAVADQELVRRLARDRILVECCLTSNRQTGAVGRDEVHPLVRFRAAGVPVAICCDNTTVSGTDLRRESERFAELIGRDEVAAIHREAAAHSFIRSSPPPLVKR